MDPPRAPSATTGSRKGPDPTERDACRFLAEQVEPLLVKERREPLARAVHHAAAEGRLAPLARLPERLRRELLELIEGRVESGTRPPSPAVIVRLTSVVSATPVPDRGTGRLLAAPAR